MSPPSHALTGLVSFVLQLSNGQYIATPEHPGLCTHSIELAQVWLWPLHEGTERRAERIAQVRKRMPWTGPLTPVRSRP